MSEIRPLDVNQSRRSRGSQSFQSHASAAASTRSWVQSTHYNPPPPPAENLRLPSPVPLLRPINLDDDYMGGQPGDAPEVQNALGLHVVNTSPKPKNRFVGGFVTNVKRVFRRRGREQPVWRNAITEEGSGSANTAIPRYISTPPTPLDLEGPRMPAAQPVHVGVDRASVPDVLVSGDVRRRRAEQNGRGQRVMESYAPPPTEVPIDNTFRAESFLAANPSRPASGPSALSPQPSQRQGPPSLVSPRPSRRSRVSITTPQPSPPHQPSIQAHPPLADDYRRMSLTKQGGTSSGGDGSEPSFDSELNPIHHFFSTLYQMPWISTERIAVDYFPGMKRGAWTWRWAKQTGKEGRVRVQVPIPKPVRSWYTNKKNTTVVERATSTKVGDRHHHQSLTTPRDDPLDLLSSGGESAGSPLSVISFVSRSSRPIRRTQHHQSHRRSYVIFPAPENVYGHSPSSKRHTGKRRRTHTHDKSRHQRHRSSTNSRSPPLYPHGYVPAPTPPPSKRTTSPVPTVTPSGFYVMTPPPVTAGQYTPQPAPMPYLTPVYMQMFPPAAMSDVSSSPGLAGRGAGHGFGPMTMPIPMPGQYRTDLP